MSTKLDIIWTEHRKTLIELFVIVIIAVNIFMLSTYMELYDRLAELNQKYHPLHIDELFWIVLFLILAFANFSWHRYKELTVEIAERKKIENSLRESEAKYSTLVENTTDAIVIIQDDILKFANKGFLKMVNAGPKKVIGKRFQDWVSPESLGTLSDPFGWMKTKQPAISIYEIVLKKTDGTKIPVEINTAKIEFDGSTADLVVIRDITERKHMEAKIESYTTGLESLVREKTKELEDSYHKLQKVDKMRAEFIDVAAHELRTPLTSIKGYIDLMRSGHVGNFSHKEEPTLGDMSKNIEGLNNLINDMLDYTRTEDRLLDLSFVDISLSDLGKEVLNSFNIMAGTRSINLLFDSKKDARIKGDKDAMKKVFINLVGNAIKYSKKGGSVSVKIMDKKDRVRVTVSDTGIGIKKNELPYIFDRFYMGDTSLTREKDQMGFGLSIAKSIVERHGGEIWAESKKGKGSKFIFSVPK